MKLKIFNIDLAVIEEFPMSLWKVNDNYLLWLKAIQVSRDSSGLLVFAPVYTPLVRVLKGGVLALQFKLWGSEKCLQVTLWPKLHLSIAGGEQAYYEKEIL